jgi:hypothetical protein
MRAVPTALRVVTPLFAFRAVHTVERMIEVFAT